MKSCSVTIQIIATKQYFPVVLRILLYKMVPKNFWVGVWNPVVWPFKSKLLSSPFFGTIYDAVQGGLKDFLSLSLSVDEILKRKLTLTSSTYFCTFF